jgi:hypothetical protein
MITKACKACENWVEKDIIYTVGVAKNNNLINLCMVYGMDYAASGDIYSKIKTKIIKGINSIENVEFSETKELGRVNRVDPLGITYFRIRGMWGIENPFQVFNYIYQKDNSKSFNFFAIINKEKYDELDFTDELENQALVNKNLLIEDTNIKVPDNPAQLKEVKLIKYSI